MFGPDVLCRSDLSPGAYLEFAVRNCSSVYASLHNLDIPNTTEQIALQARDNLEVARLNFRPSSKIESPTAPVSVVSRIDQGEYKYFHQCKKGLLALTTAGLESAEDHVVRIIAPGIDDEGQGGMKFEGVWLNNGGRLLPMQRKGETTRTGPLSEPPPMRVEASTQYSRPILETEEGQKRTVDLCSKSQHLDPLLSPRKTLEIVTNAPHKIRAQSSNGSFAALVGWEALVGDMFEADHVNIKMDGVCLTSSCVRTAAQPATVKDVLFRRYRFESERFHELKTNCW